MALTIKGIISFPALFQPKVAQGATDAKFSGALLLHPNDPQVTSIQQAVETAKLDGFPNGYTGTDECFQPYDQKYAGKDYYDPRFSGWWVLSFSAKADDKPTVVDMNLQPVIDPAAVYSGKVVHVSLGISAYTKGRGGIGGWLNGVMVTEEPEPMGRLDNKPTAEQMFAGVSGGAAQQPPQAPMQQAAQQPPQAPPAPNAAPAVNAQTTTAPPAPPQPAVPTGPQMTAAAGATTYEQYKAAGWTDQQLVDNGLMVAPAGGVPNFNG